MISKLYKSNKLFKQLVDQTAHVVFGALIFVLIATASNIGMAILGGAALGFLRELSSGDQQFRFKRFKEMGWGSYLDIVFWAVGGAVAWLLLM